MEDTPVKVDNPKKGKLAIIAGITIVFLGIIFIGGGAESFGQFLLITGICSVIYGKLVHWYHWE